MAEIIGKTTRRRRRKHVGNSTVQATNEITISSKQDTPEPWNSTQPQRQQNEYVYGKEFCKHIKPYPANNECHPETNRRKVPNWVSPDNIELFHAFCVAYDELGTSFRPLECRYFEE